MTEVPVLIWITCRNYENYLSTALQSAHCQSVRCAVMVAHDKCGEEDPIGLSASRNLALKSSVFEAMKYIVFLDADDAIPPDYIQKLLEKADSGVVVASLAEMWGEQAGVITPNFPVSVESLLAGNTIHCSAMISTALLRQYGGYDESLKAWEDWEMWTKLASKGVEFRLRGDTALWYRRHSDSMNHKFGDTVEEMRSVLRTKYA